MGNVFPPYDPGNGFQGCTNKAITWRVGGEFLKPARHQAPIQQLMTFRGQYTIRPPHTIDHLVTRLIAKTQATTLSHLNCTGKISATRSGRSSGCLPGRHFDATCAKQVRGIEHQQPELRTGMRPMNPSVLADSVATCTATALITNLESVVQVPLCFIGRVEPIFLQQ